MLRFLESTPLVGGTPDAPVVKRWSVFVKVDCGYHRAGRDAHSGDIVDFCVSVASSPHVM